MVNQDRYASILNIMIEMVKEKEIFDFIKKKENK